MHSAPETCILLRLIAGPFFCAFFLSFFLCFGAVATEYRLTCLESSRRGLLASNPAICSSELH